MFPKSGDPKQLNLNFRNPAMTQMFFGESGACSGFNVFQQSPRSVEESPNEMYEDDEEDQDDDNATDLGTPSSEQNFTELLTQQPVNPIPEPHKGVPDKRIWSRTETTALISAFMNTSTDTIVGTNQKKGMFWKRVVQSYNAAREANPDEISFRTPSSLKGRWLRISEAVLKWCGSIDKAKSRRRSGQNDDDVVQEAHQIHENSFGRFYFYEEWILIKKWDKYRSILDQQVFKPSRGRPWPEPTPVESLGSGSSGKRSRDEGDGSTPNTPSSGGIGDEFVPRAEGVKKAKSRLKGKETASIAVEALETFNERLKLFGEVRVENSERESERLEIEKMKEARKQKQIELEEKNIQMQQFKMNWDMLQQLSAKEVRAPWEEEMMIVLQNNIKNYRGF